MSDRPDFERMSVDKRSSMTAEMVWELKQDLPGMKKEIASLQNFRSWIRGAAWAIGIMFTGMTAAVGWLFAKGK